MARRGTDAIRAESSHGRCLVRTVQAVGRAAAITDPARIAAMLARLPRVPLLRAYLRRLAAVGQPRQVPLL